MTSRSTTELVLCLACAVFATGCSGARQTGEDTEAAAAADPATAVGPAAGDVLLESIPGSDVSFEMVFVPGGKFTMGSPDDEAQRGEDEGPQIEVTLSEFWIGKYEVTQREFALFRFRDRDTDSTRSADVEFAADAVARPSPPYEDPAHGMGGPPYPAAGMTQWAAVHYAKWLTDKTGRFYRLPTEAEWEYACRSGASTAYGFGDDARQLDPYAWHYLNSDETLQPVGEKRPNAFGIHDMHGNVAEWTMDQYAPLFYESIETGQADPWSVPRRLHPRTVRGGAYDDDPEALRCANRLPSSMNWKRRDPQIPKSFWWNTDSPFVGFRLVSPLNPPNAEEQADFWRLNLGE